MGACEARRPERHRLCLGYCVRNSNCTPDNAREMKPLDAPCVVRPGGTLSTVLP
ncbi:hypothetical protein P7K49_040140, partial [Saguinus oedipus]